MIDSVFKYKDLNDKLNEFSTRSKTFAKETFSGVKSFPKHERGTLVPSILNNTLELASNAIKASRGTRTTKTHVGNALDNLDNLTLLYEISHDARYINHVRFDDLNTRLDKLSTMGQELLKEKY